MCVRRCSCAWLLCVCSLPFFSCGNVLLFVRLCLVCLMLLRVLYIVDCLFMSWVVVVGSRFVVDCCDCCVCVFIVLLSCCVLCGMLCIGVIVRSYM